MSVTHFKIVGLLFVLAPSLAMSQGKEALRSIEDVILDIRSTDPASNYGVLMYLKSVGAQSKVYAPALSRALDASADETEKVRLIVAIGALASNGGIAVPSLARSLTDDSHRVREAAAGSLGEIGIGAKSAVPFLKSRLEIEKNAAVVVEVGGALCRIGRDESGVRVLEKQLRSDDPKIRLKSVIFLGECGRAARSSAQSLLRLLTDESRVVRIESAYSIWRIEQNRQAIAVLRHELTDEKGNYFRFQAARYLWEIEKDPNIISFLIRFVRDGDDCERIMAANELGHIGLEASAALDCLRQLRSDTDMNVKEAAEGAIKRITNERK